MVHKYTLCSYGLGLVVAASKTEYIHDFFSEKKGDIIESTILKDILNIQFYVDGLCQ